MAVDVKVSLVKTSVVVTVILAILGLAGAWLLIPYRLSIAEAEIKEVRLQSAKDHDMLQRIDERTGRMEKALERIRP